MIQERLPSSMDLLQTYFWLGARWGPACKIMFDVYIDPIRKTYLVFRIRQNRLHEFINLNLELDQILPCLTSQVCGGSSIEYDNCVTCWLLLSSSAVFMVMSSSPLLANISAVLSNFARFSGTWNCAIKVIRIHPRQ